MPISGPAGMMSQSGLEAQGEMKSISANVYACPTMVREAPVRAVMGPFAERTHRTDNNHSRGLGARLLENLSP